MNRSDTHRYLITYDIPDDKRRTRISKLLRSYGERMQYSVFLVDLHKSSLVRLTSDVEDLMDHQADSVLVCDLGLSSGANKRTITSIGAQAELDRPQSFII